MVMGWELRSGGERLLKARDESFPPPVACGFRRCGFL